MPIRIIDPTEIKTLDLGGGAAVDYTEASGDECRALILASQDKRTGEPKAHSASLRLFAAHIVDWRGFEDRTGAAIPWPGAGKALGRPESPTDAELEAREKLIEHCPWNVIGDFDRAIGVTYLRAAESGKD